MLNKFFVENFQSLEYPQSVRLAPLTIIVGANSAGKSSMSRAIRVIQQSVEEREYRDESEIRFAGNRIDLAGFNSVVSNHAKREVIRIGIGAKDTGGIGTENFSFAYNTSEVVVEIRSNNDKVSFELKFKVEYEIAKQDLPPVEDEEFFRKIEDHSPEKEILGRGTISFNTSSTDAPYKTLEVSVDGETSALREFLIDFDPGERQSISQKGGNVLWSQKVPDSIDGIASLDESQILDPSQWTYLPCELVGFTPGVILSKSKIQTLEGRNTGKVVNFLALLAREIMSNWQQKIRQIRWVGPLRTISTGSITKKSNFQLIDSAGNNLQEALLSMRDQIFKRVSDRLHTVTDGAYRLDRATYSSDNPLFPTMEQVILVDMSSGKNIPVSFQDAGVGISQVLPILAQLEVPSLSVMRASKARRQVDSAPIFIEQPELHLHPRMQAALADTFINHVAKPRRGGSNRTAPRSQIVLETHSEAMIMRVQRRIREGVLSADDVCVIAVDNFAGGGSLAQEYRFSADGSFIDELPRSFSDLRLNELLGKD